jgi:hypothetical protein
VLDTNPEDQRDDALAAVTKALDPHATLDGVHLAAGIRAVASRG